MKQKTIGPEIGGEKYSQIIRHLRKLPLEERIDIDWQRATELGHEPKKLLHKPVVALYAEKLLPEHLTKPDRWGYREILGADNVVGGGARILDKYMLNAHDVKAVQLKAYEDWMAKGRFDIAMGIAIAGKLGYDKLKAAGLQYFKYYLKELHYDDAKKIADEAGLTAEDIRTVALQAYEDMMYGGDHAEDHLGGEARYVNPHPIRANYGVALEIAKHYGLGQDMIIEAAQAIFRVNYRKGYTSDAISIARKYRLRDNLVLEVVIDSYNRMVNDCSGNGIGYFAAKLAEEFELGKELITKAALAEYAACMRRGEFTDGYNCSAVSIAEKFDLGKDKVIAAVLKAFEQEMSTGYYIRAAEIAERYGLDKALLESAKTLAEIAKNK